MAKRSTRKKSVKRFPQEKIEEIKQGIDQAVDYIKEWKRTQLLSLAGKSSTKIPVCIPVKKNTYIMGRHGLTKRGQFWEVYDSSDESTKIFSCRPSAVVYSLSTQTKRYKLAKEVAERDERIINIRSRIDLFRARKESARKKQDYWRYDYFDILCNSEEYHLEDAKNQLGKSLNLAKYFKIWE